MSGSIPAEGSAAQTPSNRAPSGGAIATISLSGNVGMKSGQAMGFNASVADAAYTKASTL
jgi:hypothetical protein